MWQVFCNVLIKSWHDVNDVDQRQLAFWKHWQSKYILFVFFLFKLSLKEKKTQIKNTDGNKLGYVVTSKRPMNKVCDIWWGPDHWSFKSNQQGLKLNSKKRREPLKRSHDQGEKRVLLRIKQHPCSCVLNHLDHFGFVCSRVTKIAN